jgi:hypothetical protein
MILNFFFGTPGTDGFIAVFFYQWEQEWEGEWERMNMRKKFTMWTTHSDLIRSRPKRGGHALNLIVRRTEMIVADVITNIA